MTETLFAAALLAFLLPFGTVSCGEPVTFTGLELATATVHGDDADLVEGIEYNGSFFAIVAGISVLVGTGLALTGRRGQGRVALAGLLSLAVLPWIAALHDPLLGSADFVVRIGYVVSTAALAAVVGIRARLLVRWRRAEGHPTRLAMAGLWLLALFVLLTALLCLSPSSP